MSTTTHQRRQLRLPGQAAAPEGPVDMTIMYLMHHAFRRDLRAFSEAVPRTPVEDRDTWRALADRWDHFSAVLHHHHTGEDTWLWPFLMDRATEDERVTLAAMEAEHAEIDPGLAACTAGFARLVDHADEDARAALSVRLCAVREALGRHLRHEETDTLALLQRVMTQEEWEEIDKEFGKGVTFPFLLRTIPWVMHEVPYEAREHVFASSGLAHRLLWRLTRPGFERLQARAFRYAP
jgi:hemerythrin-like domain-containing protein